MDKKSILKEVRNLTVAFTISASIVVGAIVALDYLTEGCGKFEKYWKAECANPK